MLCIFQQISGLNGVEACEVTGGLNAEEQGGGVFAGGWQYRAGQCGDLLSESAGSVE
jgi:hypothetical protein